MESNELLIVIDMQNDFLTGALGNSECAAIVDKVAERIDRHIGEVWFTRDTHGVNYLNTQEGKKLPVPHCQKYTEGWHIDEMVGRALSRKDAHAINKPSFGSLDLADEVRAAHIRKPFTSITLCGVCTDICVISNAMLLKAAVPEVPIIVDAALCAGVTPESHQIALKAMAACQIDVINND